MSAWRDALCRFFKVPPQPEPPPGNPPRTFRAARNFYYLKLIQRFFGQFVVFMFAVLTTVGAVALYRADAPAGTRYLSVAASVFFWAMLALDMIIGYAVVRLEYELRWYMVSDRAIRIREGILTVKEKTIALANIQNISIKQGPLQRLLGIADVEVRTAGGSEQRPGQGNQGQVAEPLHVGYFRGVDNAEEIRDLLRESARRYADAGLGDPDDHHTHVLDEDDAAQALLEECRELRHLLERAASSG